MAVLGTTYYFILQVLNPTLQYIKKRMTEMIESSVINRKNFGHVYELRNGDEFLDTVDNQDNSDVLIVIHIWDKASEACKTINEGLQTISKEYNYIKFCRIQVFFLPKN